MINTKSQICHAIIIDNRFTIKHTFGPVRDRTHWPQNLYQYCHCYRNLKWPPFKSYCCCSKYHYILQIDQFFCLKPSFKHSLHLSVSQHCLQRDKGSLNSLGIQMKWLNNVLLYKINYSVGAISKFAVQFVSFYPAKHIQSDFTCV